MWIGHRNNWIARGDMTATTRPSPMRSPRIRDTCLTCGASAMTVLSGVDRRSLASRQSGSCFTHYLERAERGEGGGGERVRKTQSSPMSSRCNARKTPSCEQRPLTPLEGWVTRNCARYADLDSDAAAQSYGTATRPLGHSSAPPPLSLLLPPSDPPPVAGVLHGVSQGVRGRPLLPPPVDVSPPPRTPLLRLAPRGPLIGGRHCRRTGRAHRCPPGCRCC